MSIESKKENVDQLAVFGGLPAFSEELHVGCPNIGDRGRLLERFNDILDARRLTNDGRFVREFEQRIAELVGVKHCVAICNGTVALEIAIRALGMKGEVILPSFTFIATAHALQWQGITPIFCDIEPGTHNLDPERVEQAITLRTTGIIGVHVWGLACAIETLSEIAARRGLKLLFDAAHAFGCSSKGQMIGSFGDAEVFSFHATKLVNSLEGGAVVTNNDDLAKKVRSMRNFGFTDYDKVSSIGTNAKMNEVSAAVGLTNIESMAEFIAVNRRNYEQYAAELAGLDGMTLLTGNKADEGTYQYIIFEIDERKTTLTRDQLIEILHAENVLARRYFFPGCHRMEPYRSSFPDAGPLLTETERLAGRVLALPTGTAIASKEIRGICDIIKLAISNGEEASERLRFGLAAPVSH
jgi:dTDP-4-amino-4,6-dideoxygalactose transaminase